MMFSDNGKISVRQFQCLIISDFTALFMAIIPLVLFGANIDGTLAEILIALGIGAAVLYFASKITPKKKNSLVLKILCLFLFAKTLFVNGVYISTAQKVITQYVFEGLHMSTVTLLFAFLSVYVCFSGKESRGRMAEVTAFFILIAVVLIFLLVFYRCDIRELKCVFDVGRADAVRIFKVLLLMGGIETLYFILPDVKEKKESSAVAAFGITALAVLVMICLSVCLFGAETDEKMWPVFQMMANIDFPGLLLERQDVLFMGMYIVGLAMFWVHTVYFMMVYAGKVIEKAEGRCAALVSDVSVMLFVIGFGSGIMTEAVFNAIMILNALTAVFSAVYMLFWGEV